MLHSIYYCLHRTLMSGYAFAFWTPESVQSQLVDQLLEGEDIVNMPVSGVNETMEVKVSINFLKVIQLV